MKSRGTPITALALALVAPAFGADDPAEFFEKKVRPALVEYCYECHSEEAGKIKGGLRLDTRAGWETGGDSGPAIVPGKPEDSILITAIRRLDKDLAMPPKKELPASAVADLTAWVQSGAFDPRSDAPVAKADEKPAYDFAAERQKWAFRQVAKPEVPDAKDSAWTLNEVDRFIAEKLRAEGLPTAEPASPGVLLRRLAFDLTGLPPTAEEVDAFEKACAVDRKAAANAAIERLLASPHYGEKWGRHWLDVVRYADSHDSRGSGQDGDIRDAWRYRDWVVAAFNDDMPYTDFIRQQVAGDLLAAREWDPQKVVATGVFAIGNWGNGDSDKQKVYTDMVDDQVDVIGRAFMGLTVSCARCHDHKFDPITTADYYGLAGFFFSSRIVEKFNPPTAGESLMRIALLSPAEKAERESAKKRIAEIDGRLAEAMTPLAEKKPGVSGKDGLTGWTPRGKDNPSIVVNRTGADVKFSTVSLGKDELCLHPGPKTPVSAVWRSPVRGPVKIEGRLTDADGNCGDGIVWELRSGDKVLAKGEMANGGNATFAHETLEVNEQQLVRLVVKPRGEYTCDSTKVDLVVSATDGKRWDFRAAMAGGEEPGSGAWLVCAGDGEKLGRDEQAVRALEDERKGLAAKIDNAARAQGLQDGGIPGTKYEGFHDARVHIRGSYARLGEVQPRGFPELFAAPAPEIEGSGRLALADWLASASHPLTARVMVNRIWQHHFGEGIVRTPNNFGKLGEPPTHPELLDWLAARFVESGWSIKAIHRIVCQSATYQRSGTPSPESRQTDPSNRLLSHQTRRKLSAEDLRDALLVAAGKLDRTAGGESTADIQSGRRTLYLRTVRSDRSSYRMLFDGADPTGIVEKRTDSVVAPQALWLMNHPFALAQSAALKEAMEKEAGQAAGERIAWLWRRVFARAPREDEARLASEWIGGAGDAGKVWTQLCHSLLCSNEFLFVD